MENRLLPPHSLPVQILKVLRQHNEGLSEFALICKLQSSGHLPKNGVFLNQSLSLFRTHFLVFHYLYLLRDRLWKKELAHLYISPLRITLLKHQPQMAGLVNPDRLREYYLDLNQLSTTSEYDVDEALSGFWSKLNDQGSCAKASEKSRALAVLELNEPISFKDVKKQYRKLAMFHHPDRGGSNEKLQEINVAMQLLSACFK